MSRNIVDGSEYGSIFHYYEVLNPHIKYNTNVTKSSLIRLIKTIKDSKEIYNVDLLNDIDINKVYIPILLKTGEGGYVVRFPDFTGCVSYGKDIEECKTNATEAISLHLSSMIEDGDEINIDYKNTLN